MAKAHTVWLERFRLNLSWGEAAELIDGASGSFSKETVSLAPGRFAHGERSESMR
jgi:hypothetical protein